MKRYLRAYTAGVILVLLGVLGAALLGHAIHVPTAAAATVLAPAVAILLLKLIDHALAWIGD